jgi:O-antigen/teichoic acid export membrane protein
VAPAKRLISNFVKVSAGNVIGQFFFFLGLAHLARVLGPAEFGVWNFAQVWMLYLLRAGEFGLEIVGIRETAREKKLLSTWIATVVSLRFVLALLLFGFAYLVYIANLLPPGTASLVLICALSVFPVAFLLEWVFEARQEVGLISIARILKGFLFFLGVLAMVSNSEDAERAAYLYVGSLVLPGLMILSVVMSRFGFDWSSLSLRSSLDALRKSAPIGIATLLSQYSLVAATMMVGYFLSKEELGYFTAAHRIVILLWAYIIASMHRILLPSLSKTFHESLPHYRRFVEKSFRLTALTAVPVGLVGTLCATPLMKLLYSAQYEASGVVFGILLWGFVLANIRSILEIALVASDKQRRFMNGMVFLSVTYSVLTPILTLRFGIVGAAVAVVVSELSYFTYLVFTSPFSEPATLLSNSWKPLVAAIIAMAPLLPLAGIHPVLQVALGSTLFGIVVVALKGVTFEDFEVVRSLFRRDSLEPSA